MSPAPTTANYNHNSRMLTEAFEYHRAESAMLSTENLNGFFSQPEVPIDEQRFPLRQRALQQQQQQQQQQQEQLKPLQRKFKMSAAGKFPLLQTDCSHGTVTFPVQHQYPRFDCRPIEIASYRFPVQMIHQPQPQRFPMLRQLPERNFNYSTQSISVWGCGSAVATPSRPSTLNAFPTIKKQFVSFPNNQAVCKQHRNSNANAEHGNGQNSGPIAAADVVPSSKSPPPSPRPPTAARAATAATAAKTRATTVTQASHNMSTEIDMDSQRTVDADNDNDDEHVHGAGDDDGDDEHSDGNSDDGHHDDVRKAFDNELNAREQTLNLNVEADAEGVGERKEIEHQQAENFNDAFGWRHDNNDNNDNSNSNSNSNNNNNEKSSKSDGKGEGEGEDNDAMNAGTAKNKREICEQSKLEAAAAHNDLNMTKERRQSICLASEQLNQTTIAEEPAASTRQQRLSDARESSSEQVDGQQRQEISACQPAVSQTAIEAAARLPSLEFLKSTVRALLDEGVSRVPHWDLDLIDLLAEFVQLIIATPASRTGNLWAEPVVEQVVVGECTDMTLTKVSDESEATAVVVDIDSEQFEQPAELDDNSNSNSSSNRGDMKYDLLKSTPRLPDTLPSRLSSTTASAISAVIAPATSRIRDVATVPSAASTSRPLLGEIKRSPSSREEIAIDVDSLLPERTRLRRQRRMRSQESVEEKPEDVIERLNKLKARISGALCEVKGVLKQYSTESEAEAAGVKWTGPPKAPAEPPTEAPAAVQPVQFRFVKKVRRRSYFDEADEDKNKQETVEVKPEPKQLKEEANTAKVNEEADTEGKQRKEEPILMNAKDNQKALDEPSALKCKENAKRDQTKEDGQKEAEKSRAQAKLEFLAKVQSELKSKPKEKEPAAAGGILTKEKPIEKLPEAAIKEEPKKDAEATAKAQLNEEKSTETTPVEQPAQDAVNDMEQSKESVADKGQQQPVEAVEATTQTAALPDESATQPTASGDMPPKKVAGKKKTIVKVRNPRRASIAAVEPSKIKPEPVQIDALIQRRPSDSEAIVKRKKKQKLTTPTTIASGSAESSERAATAAAVAATPQLQQATTAGEQLVTAKVNKSVDTAKSVTKTTAKSVETKPEAAATAPPKNAATATAATATATATATPQTAPKQLPIDELVNQAAASEQSRRASLKLAELVGETVLVVPAATATATTAAAATVADPTTPSAASSSLSQSKELINQTLISPASAVATPQQVVVGVDIEVAPADAAVAATPQIAATLSEVSHEESSPQQPQQQQQQQSEQDQAQPTAAATKDNAQAQTNNSLAAMPELKVLAGPVHPVKIETVEQPHDEADLVVSAKKTTHLKKLVRKSSIDKGKEKGAESAKLSNILKDKNKIGDLADRLNKLTPPKKQQAKPVKEQQAKPVEEQQAKPVEEQLATGDSTELEQHENAEETDTTIDTETVQPELELEPAPECAQAVPKKPRQIKKKVIIKRQKRRLSIGDTFFIQQEPEEPQVPEIETIEKAIAYVTDDEAEDAEPEPETESAKPLKSCLHVREYKIGDLVLYAERYRKTQVRWKRGRVLERITSISYKLDIDGKEVPAHVSYIKKYTGRKVKFVGKEYLEIDYEQVAEEERRARSYSIWNMV